jgi:D-alanyl-lipoteichoic acid acyltransferase DltB (MBOAT superfamily)
MIFNSLTYLFFLSAACALYWLLPRAPRLWMLFFASVAFYGFWNFLFVPLLLFSVLVDYVAGLWLGRLPDGRRRNAVMVVALSINLLVLGIFKYLVFFLGQAEGLARLLGFNADAGFSLPFHIILPLGISFYSFQSMSYTIDVWRRVAAPEREFVLFANYVIYFPQLVAGPILRAGEIMWQLDRRPQFVSSDILIGLRRVASGLFLKCVLADNIAPLVDRGFGNFAVSDLGAIDVFVLAFLFGFQIYFDFAGYSHIALGSARLMGIRFPENFNFPYLAPNPREFWRRWHISLSSWIRDYLYLPLCGTRGGTRSVDGLDIAGRVGPHPLRRTVALWVTWTLMGLWHGANWTFVLWGLWHAAILSVHRLASRLSIWEPPAVVGWTFTLPLMMLGWIPFRAESFDAALSLWARIVTQSAWLRPDVQGGGFPFWLALHRDSYYVAAAVLLLIVAAWAARRFVMPSMARRPVLIAVAEATAFAVMVPLIFLYLRPVNQFIYFQF